MSCHGELFTGKSLGEILESLPGGVGFDGLFNGVGEVGEEIEVGVGFDFIDADGIGGLIHIAVAYVGHPETYGAGV